jgi:hypothetical protein
MQGVEVVDFLLEGVPEKTWQPPPTPILRIETEAVEAG